jgi:hypothetical protein
MTELSTESAIVHYFPCSRCGEKEHCACWHDACCFCGSKEHSAPKEVHNNLRSNKR